MTYGDWKINIFIIIDTRISFCSRYTHLLPPKPKSLQTRCPGFSYELCFGSSRQSWLVYTNAYKLQPSLSERVIIDAHGCYTALPFGAKAKEN